MAIPPDGFVPGLADLAPVVVWLRDKGVPPANVADILKTNTNYLRVLKLRAKRQLGQPKKFWLSSVDLRLPPNDDLRKMLGVRPHAESISIDRRERSRVAAIDDLEEQIERAAGGFWNGVRFETSLPEFRALLIHVGNPAHPRAIRQKARLRQLVAETLLHSGKSSSSIKEGLRSLLLSRVAFHESRDRLDLEQLGRTARLISQAHLLRGELDAATRYLAIHRAACERLGVDVRPEYFHQMAVAAIQTGGADDAAKPLLTEAMSRLSQIVDYGAPKKRHEVLDIGARQTNLIDGDWYAAEELLDFACRCYPPDDIHVPINVSWAAATGFSTDDESIHQRAGDLLEKHAGAAAGYGRQATTLHLLRMAIDLPFSIRRDFARLALYQNAFRDS